MDNYIKVLTADITGNVAISHVVDLSYNLEGVIHGADHVVQAVSNQSKSQARI